MAAIPWVSQVQLVLPQFTVDLFLLLLPFALWAVGSAQFGLRGRVQGLIAVGALFLFLYEAKPYRWTTLAQICVSIVYLLASATCFELLRRLIQIGLVSRLTVFLLATALFIFIPATLFHTSTGRILPILGFEFAFSAFSYSVEAGRGRTSPRLLHALHFILVNPVLVYTDRGSRRGPPGFTWHGLSRCAVGGVSVMLYHLLLFAPISLFATYGRRSLGEYAVIVGRIWYDLFLVYLVHSGAASMRIGLMRLFGYDVPERYRFPFLATSPRDVWRRWNIYVGRWFLRYIFVPVTRRCRKGIGLQASQAMATVGVFGLCGAMHEGVIFARTSNLRWGALVGFLLMGLISGVVGAASAFEWEGKVTSVSKLVVWVLTIHMVTIGAILILPAIGN